MQYFLKKVYESFGFYLLILLINLHSIFFLQEVKDRIRESEYHRNNLSILCECEFWISLFIIIYAFLISGRFKGTQNQKNLMILLTLLNCLFLVGVIIASYPFLLP